MSADPRGGERPVGSADISPDELEQMAANGATEAVRSLFARLPRWQRVRFASPRVLEEVVRGGVRRLRSLPAHARRTADEERELVESALQLALASRPGEAVLRREAFRALLEWTEQLRGESRLAEALAGCEAALERGAVHHPELYPRLVLAKAALLVAHGRMREAHVLLETLYARADLIAERNVVPELIRALGRTALHVGQAALFKRLLIDGLGAFYSSLDERRAILDLLCRAHRGAIRFLAGGDAGLADKLLFLAHWTCLRGIAPLLGRAAWPLERGLLGVVYLHNYFGPRRQPAATSEGANGAVLVTRAMGGVGDLLTMTPGLHALAARHGRVDLAVPRRLFPVFESNPDVTLIDIHSELDPRSYRWWFNLTDCPAARVESLTAPRVRRGRIESFARGMGIRGARLRGMERRPRYVPTDAELEERDRFFAAHGLAGRTVIGVQYRSEESYRDYPHMAALIEALARDYRVLVFDSREVPGCDHDGVVKVMGRPLREAFALASGCRAVVAPDSSFVHLAGALDLPCVALSGPTDGKVRTADYPRCRFLDARRELACVPCWRNERIRCALTGRHASVCLGEIAVPSVVAALEALLGGESKGPAGREATRRRPS